MLRKLAVLAVVLAVTAAPALAVQATTQITLNMPSLVILYYRSSVTFNVTDTDLAGVLLTGANPNNEGPVILAGLGGDANVTGADYSAGAVTTTVTNFWGVRSIAPVGDQTQVTVSFSPANLSNGTDTITMNNALTDLAGVGGFASNQAVFAPTGMALQLGDVRFDLDLSGMASPGSYTGGGILIDAVNI